MTTPPAEEFMDAAELDYWYTPDVADKVATLRHQAGLSRYPELTYLATLDAGQVVLVALHAYLEDIARSPRNSAAMDRVVDGGRSLLGDCYWHQETDDTDDTDEQP